jgi:hypothetical protein
VSAIDTAILHPLYPEVYIDGVSYGSGISVDVWIQEGSHYVEVDDCVWSDYLGCYCYFSHFEVYYPYWDLYYSNPASITVNSDTMVYAWYAPY